MVAGFYFTHIMAINIPTICEQNPFSVFIGVLLYITAFCCLLTSLATIFIYNGYFPAYANLTSLHSWYGISAACLYTANLILVCAKLSYKPSDSRRISKCYNFILHVNPILEVISIVASTIAISTGITNYIGSNLCIYTVSSYQWNPAGEYANLLPVCKLVNGLGILIISTSFLVIFVVYFNRQNQLKMLNINPILSPEISHQEYQIRNIRTEPTNPFNKEFPDINEEKKE